MSATLVLAALLIFPQVGPTSWKKQWVVQANLGGRPAPVTVAKDGTSYLVIDNFVRFQLQATGPDGKVRWTAELADDALAAPVIMEDGRILVGSWDGTLAAFTTDGKPAWRYRAKGAITGSPAVGADGVIYAGSRDDCLHAVDKDGKGRWTFKTRGWVHAAPAIAADGTVYAASWDGFLYSVGADGKERWRFETKRPISARPVVVGEEVLVASEDGNLYALSKEGKEVWRHETKGWIPYAPCVDGERRITVHSNDGSLTQLDRTGKVLWTFQAGQPQTASVVDKNGTVYAVCGRSLKAISTGGMEYWAQENNYYWQSLALHDDGTLFVVVGNMLYAIKD